MRSRSIRDIRRARLPPAVFEAVIRYGLRGTIINKFGGVAWVPKGVVLHEFKHKSALPEAAIRRSNSLLSQSVVEPDRRAEPPTRGSGH